MRLMGQTSNTWPVSLCLRTHGSTQTGKHSPCSGMLSFSFFFNHTATTEIYTLSLHDALPISARCASGGTIGLHGRCRDSRPGATNRAAGKLHQHLARKKPRCGSPRTKAYRTASSSGSPSGPNFLLTGTPARYSRSGATIDCRERPDRGREGRLFPSNFTERKRRLPDGGAHQPVQRSLRYLELWRSGHPTYLYRGKNPFQCSPGGSAAAIGPAFLPTNNSRRLPQRIRRPNRISQDKRIPVSRGTPVPIRAGLRAPLSLAL